MNRRIMLLLSILICLLSACAPLPTTKAANSEFATKWAQSLLCEFPCWQDVTPGITNFSDVPSILSKNDVKITFLGDDGIEFLDKMNVQGEINKASNGLVDSISLIMIDQSIIVSDLIQYLGSPTEVILLNDMSDLKCTASLLYPEKYTLLELYLDNQSKKEECLVNVTPSHEVFRIFISTYSPEEYVKFAPLGVASRHAWKGYGNYP